MTDSNHLYTGGCLCGALRYEARCEPRYMGYCYCADCRKASGSGFIPFMGFPSAGMHFIGEPRTFTSKSARGGNADRNFCAICGGLVFGGVVGVSDEFTIYAGSLDDPSAFRPTIAIFARDRPAWVTIPAGLTVFETMPS
jgi:hypothetical protein